MKTTNKYTYDVVFQDEFDCKARGFRESIEFCKNYIRNNTEPEWALGIAQIVCNETGKIVYEEMVY